MERHVEIVDQKFSVESNIDSARIYYNLEKAARTCYQSFDKIGCGEYSKQSDCRTLSCPKHSSQKLLQKIIKLGHESVLEHESITVRFITNRAVTHELVRHRLASYSQESQRYVRYDNGLIQIIRPVWFQATCEDLNVAEPYNLNHAEMHWLAIANQTGYAYNKLLESGQSPQQARGVLINDTKTDIVMSANIREWRHVLKLRCSSAAHPQIRALMTPLGRTLKLALPILFNDIELPEE